MIRASTSYLKMNQNVVLLKAFTSSWEEIANTDRKPYFRMKIEREKKNFQLYYFLEIPKYAVMKRGLQSKVFFLPWIPLEERCLPVTCYKKGDKTYRSE